MSLLKTCSHRSSALLGHALHLLLLAMSERRVEGTVQPCALTIFRCDE